MVTCKKKKDELYVVEKEKAVHRDFISGCTLSTGLYLVEKLPICYGLFPQDI